MEKQTLMSTHILIMELVSAQKKYAVSDREDSYDLIYGVDTSDSKHTENKNNNILVLGKNALKINNTTIQVEGELKTNCFPACVPSVDYNVVITGLSLKGYVYTNGVEQYEFETKKVNL